jgi:hypothetical protein
MGKVQLTSHNRHYVLVDNLTSSMLTLTYGTARDGDVKTSGVIQKSYCVLELIKK